MKIPVDDKLFERVVDFVCEAEYQSPEMVRGQRRYPELVRVRKIVSAIMRDQFRWSQTRTGDQWGFDSTTVYNHLKRMSDDESKVAGDLGFLFVEELYEPQNVSVGNGVDG